MPAEVDADTSAPAAIGLRYVQRPDDPEEVTRHNLTHLPHASWCPICVPARARDDAHRQRREIDQLGDPDVTVLQLDYVTASPLTSQAKARRKCLGS